MLLFSSGAWAAADVVLVDLPFSDASSPSLTPDGSNSNRGTANYEYDSPINGAKFLNVWGENNSNGFKVATITDQDVTTYGQWTLEFDWAGYSGCNKKAVRRSWWILMEIHSSQLMMLPIGVIRSHCL